MSADFEPRKEEEAKVLHAVVRLHSESEKIEKLIDHIEILKGDIRSLQALADHYPDVVAALRALRNYSCSECDDGVDDPDGDYLCARHIGGCAELEDSIRLLAKAEELLK